MLKNRRNKIIEMLTWRKKKELIEKAIIEIEKAISNLDDNQKLINNTLFRPEDLAKVYNNEQLSKFKLKSLVSVLKKNTRL